MSGLTLELHQMLIRVQCKFQLSPLGWKFNGNWFYDIGIYVYMKGVVVFKIYFLFILDRILTEH